MDIGDRIRVARKKAGLTQRTLAQLADVSRGLIGQVESHVKQPGRDTLQKLAVALNTSSSSLMGETDEYLEKLILSDRNEIELVKLYRDLSQAQQRSHLALFRTSVTVRREIEQERRPTKRKMIDA
jgi:transcriptional regulator with XRE-family HTH domain